MEQPPVLILWGVVLDSPDARALADFYHRLLGWAVEQDEPGWVKLRSPAGGPGLSFQTEAAYVRPTWPAGPSDQQMSIHLDIAVDDLAAAGVHAIRAGAVLAGHQPQDDVRVYLDPAGHPFCLFLPGPPATTFPAGASESRPSSGGAGVGHHESIDERHRHARLADPEDFREPAGHPPVPATE